MFRRVSVWLDDLAPDHGAFAHASEWAARLRVPLHAVAAPLTVRGGRPRTPAAPVCLPAADGGAAPREAAPGGGTLEAWRACGAVCSRRGVAWDTSVWAGPFSQGVEEFFRPVELCVFGSALPAAVKETFLRRSLRSPGTSALVCPKSWEPFSRVLVLQQHRDPDRRFLETAAEVCRVLEVTPVVLTVSGSEKQARLRQRFAEEAFARLRQGADFDLVVGGDVRTAVACGARLRGCTHVFVEGRDAPPWWRRLRGGALRRLLGLSDSLTFLTIPGEPSGCPADERRSRGGGRTPG